MGIVCVQTIATNAPFPQQHFVSLGSTQTISCSLDTKVRMVKVEGRKMRSHDYPLAWVATKQPRSQSQRGSLKLAGLAAYYTIKGTSDLRGWCRDKRAFPSFPLIRESRCSDTTSKERFTEL